MGGRLMDDVLWCFCGRRLETGLTNIKYCPRHKDNYYEKPKREKIGRWSGKSKSINAYGDYK